MAYSKHEWKEQELITAAKLNNIEDGVYTSGFGGGGSLSLTGTWTKIN